MNASQSVEDLEREVAERYRAEGYEIAFPPLREMLPPSLRSYTPDFVASRGKDKVAVEVKSRQDLGSAETLSQVAERFRREPGWRFDLVMVGPRLETPAAPKLLSKRDRLDRIATADRISHDGRDYAAAVILIWTVFESILRESADEDDRARILSPQRLAKEALSLGLISDEEWRVLDQLARVRNQAVHGEKTVRVTRRDYARIRDVVERLVTSPAA